MAPVAYQAYRQSQAATSGQAELIVLLYRGAVRFAAKARIHLQNDELEGAHNALLKAQDIVVELMLGLSPLQEQVTQDLYALHSYVYQVLYDANLRKETALVDEALRHLRDLLATWEEIALPRARPTLGGAVVSIDRRC
ncbi:MAG TPA: flagellar export chaperone FliS [Chloroflexota bacterium]|jgi:flagellar protein FliS|nr:flagellar export chaperone FliS [Chloroflexota bacterium]